MKDMLIMGTDNLSGLSEAISRLFSNAEIKNCIIHHIRNSKKYVSYKDLKSIVTDLKSVYQDVDQDSAEGALDRFSEKWDAKYPQISVSWRSNLERLTLFFKYPSELRNIIYTTNPIDVFNRQLRKVTKSKSVFPLDDSLLKMLYLAMRYIMSKWSKYRNWTYIYGKLNIYFKEMLVNQ